MVSIQTPSSSRRSSINIYPPRGPLGCLRGISDLKHLNLNGLFCCHPCPIPSHGHRSSNLLPRAPHCSHGLDMVWYSGLPPGHPASALVPLGPARQ